MSDIDGLYNKIIMFLPLKLHQVLIFQKLKKIFRFHLKSFHLNGLHKNLHPKNLIQGMNLNTNLMNQHLPKKQNNYIKQNHMLI